MGDEMNIQVGPRTRDPRTMMILLSVTLLLALAAAGYAWWLTRACKQELAAKRALVSILQTKIDQATAKAASSSYDLPVVVFSPGGLFTDAEKTEITHKLVDPYKAWHQDQGDHPVSLHIQQDSHVPAQYVVDAIYANGVYEGFLYGSIDAASQDWWSPTCLDACEFSASFRSAYPEVVAAASH